MDIQENDLQVVFSIMDSDRSGSLSYDEFVDQLHKMKSEDQQTMLAFLKYYVMEIREQIITVISERLHEQVKNGDERDTLLKEFMVNKLHEISGQLKVIHRSTTASTVEDKDMGKAVISSFG